MVTITNGRTSKIVTLGAFNTIYKDKGFNIVGKPKENKVDVVEDVQTIEPVEEDVEEIVDTVEEVPQVEEQEWVQELLEKPISQWSKEETANFAKEKNIDTSRARKLGEAKDIIKKWLEEQSR